MSLFFLVTFSWQKGWSGIWSSGWANWSSLILGCPCSFLSLCLDTKVGVGYDQVVELFEVVLSLDAPVLSCYFVLTQRLERGLIRWLSWLKWPKPWMSLFFLVTFSWQKVTKSQGWIILPWTFDQRNRPPPKLASLKHWVTAAIPFDQVLRVGLLGRGGFGLDGSLLTLRVVWSGLNLGCFNFFLILFLDNKHKVASRASATLFDKRSLRSHSRSVTLSILDIIKWDNHKVWNPAFVLSL